MSKYDFIKVAFNVIKITLRHGCSLVNLLPFFRKPFPTNISGWLFLSNVSFRKNEFHEDNSARACLSFKNLIRNFRARKYYYPFYY